ncbi:metabotropic glutamate receptor-like [Lineus longissimus]|uniref:metabotropic glutamate receptor-like n=1 Tax=Lineus longissimus TaxID=88925 RepID=UPI00315D0663
MIVPKSTESAPGLRIFSGCLILICEVCFAMAGIRIPNVRSLTYKVPGDINLGIILPIHYCQTCGDINYNMFQASEAVMQAVRKINNNPDLLPNITLGVRLFDDRLDSTHSLARVLQLLPERYTGDFDGEPSDIVGIFGGITSDGCLVMVIISIVTSVLMPPAVIQQMHVPTERYVELLCHLPVKALVIPIGYNLILVLISAFYGFKTRKLPNNFNESRYIFFCVCSTIFLWIAFIPTYFAAFHATHKNILLALSLLLNSTMILLCIFITRIYALFYVEEEKMHFSISSTKHDRTASERDTVAFRQCSIAEERTPL